jgi:hypothetical protein
MPVMRAVLLATTGVVVGSVVLWIKQGLHNSLEWDIQTYYTNYLDAIAWATSYQNKETLINSIEWGNFSITDFTWEVVNIDLWSIASNVFWESSIT